MTTEVSTETLRGMLISSVRYALGRQTYIVSETCGWVRSYAHAIDRKTRTVMIRDIEEQERFGYGMDMDKQEWVNLLAWLKDGQEDGAFGKY